jgi:hypothetical protein
VSYPGVVSAHPDYALAWLRQREAGWRQIEIIEEDDLRRLDSATALVHADALLAAMPLDALPEERRFSSGLVEQQRLFIRRLR